MGPVCLLMKDFIPTIEGGLAEEPRGRCWTLLALTGPAWTPPGSGQEQTAVSLGRRETVRVHARVAVEQRETLWVA